jgi:hypothetical protein
MIIEIAMPAFSASKFGPVELSLSQSSRTDQPADLCLSEYRCAVTQVVTLTSHEGDRTKTLHPCAQLATAVGCTSRQVRSPPAQSGL